MSVVEDQGSASGELVQRRCAVWCSELGPVGEEGVAVDLERAGAGFSHRTAERVDGWTDADVLEPGVFEHLLPARTGQPSGNSTGPQIDVAHCLDRDRAPVGDVSELQHTTGTQH